MFFKQKETSDRFEDINRRFKREVFWVRHKRTVIILAVAVVVAAVATVVGLMVYNSLHPAPACVVDADCPTNYRCQLGSCVIKEGVLPPEDLTIGVSQKYFFDAGNKTYDVAALIKNPSNAWAGKSFSYTFILKDKQGQEVGKSAGKNFILPAQERYLIAPAVVTKSVPATVELVIDKVDWVRVNNLDEPEFQARDLVYEKSAAGSGKAQVSGFMENRSGFNCRKVEVDVVLLNKKGEVAGVNRTIIDDFMSAEERQFEVFWPVYVSSEVTVQAFGETNILDKDNVMSSFSEEEERWQNYDRSGQDVLDSNGGVSGETVEGNL